MCQTDKFGFPKNHRSRSKIRYGFQTGDIVNSLVVNGKFKGSHFGRLVVRKDPFFMMITEKGRIQIHPRTLTRLHRMDGYTYTYEEGKQKLSPEFPPTGGEKHGTKPKSK